MDLTREDQALLDRFAGLDDQELSRSFLAAEARLRDHRNGFGRTRVKAHARADEAVEDARRQLDAALASVRFKAAGPGSVAAADLFEVVWLSVLVNEPGIAAAVHAKIDQPAVPGEADVFVSVDEEAWQARRDQLAAEVAAIERCRTLRDVVRAQDAAGWRLAALGTAA